MRIVIDLQGAQSPSSCTRGIGRYSLAIAKAIARNRGSHQVLLALSASLPETIEAIRAEFDGVLLQENIRVWQAPGPVSHLHKENDWRRVAAELIREAFLASLKPDVVLVGSLFEGLTDEVVTSVGSLGVTVPTAVILYDLIPLIYRHRYLENPATEAWYENKLAHLRRAGLLLAISESSRQEALDYLNFPAGACVAISTAADPQFRPQQCDGQEELEIRSRYGLPRPFLMYTGGIDHRKNIDGLIRAYAKLPKSVRAEHQLAVVCSVQPAERMVLETFARNEGLQKDELILTGFVSAEDLPKLYNLCKAFVFPSWHEGFGLPALEAMSCGRAVIGANTSSVPEVIGRSDALFDPRSIAAMTEKLLQVLSDDNFRGDLERHGLAQARRFSWDNTAQTAVAAIEAWYAKRIKNCHTAAGLTRRPKLAYISPLPPARSGISDYSAELLPELARHYDIDVVVAQDAVSDPWVRANCSVRDVTWFRLHSDRYDRVLYHFGNSEYHQHMFGLLEDIPGVIVLHDFFLSGILAHTDLTGHEPGSWWRALYHSHGYKAVQQRVQSTDAVDVIWRYPCNLGVLQNALGVIVHSEYSIRLADQWYGKETSADWTVIPHLRVPAIGFDQSEARRHLGFGVDDFVVCSFGLLGPTKLNHRLLDAWLGSDLAKESNCILVFVGENSNSDYGAELLNTIGRSRLNQRILITGWTDRETFSRHLAAADLAVQLRTLSRGETSGTVMDCMNFGLPTIINANGSMADVADDGVWKLPDEFADAELVSALETLWREPELRLTLGERARAIIRTRHAPRACADRYFGAIEAAYRVATAALPGLTAALSNMESKPTKPEAWLQVAEGIHRSIPPRLAQRQLLVDVSELAIRDARSGIPRVVRSILAVLLNDPPAGYRVEPVYADTDHGYRYARRWTAGFLGFPATPFTDDPVDYRVGDTFLGLDLQPHVVPAQRGFFHQLRCLGVNVWFVVYDLLPITLPQAFTEHAATSHHNWLSVVAESDGAVCISESVASELNAWVEENGKARRRPFRVEWFHLGSDIESSVPTKGIPDNSEDWLGLLSRSPTFLMVGTLEPRKGHNQTIAAFEQLWSENLSVNLVIVGKQGWMVEQLGERIRGNSEFGTRLFWYEQVSDEFLEKIYAAATCLLAASEGEGFCLPLIEAARHKLPLIARDIPVFNEVAGCHAFYFRGLEACDLADSIKEWLLLRKEGKVPSSDGIRWLTWRESTRQLLERLLVDSGAVA